MAHAPTIRAGLDVAEVTPWVLGQTDETPRTVADAEFTESRLLTATEDSGVYRGLFALLMARGARDWRTGKRFGLDTYAELHPGFSPVFPPEFCASIGVDPALARSVLNRTPMGIRTHTVIESNEPKRYLPRLQSKSLLDDAEFDAVIEGHEINPAHLLNSNWDAFVEDRKRRFLGIIEYSMDKPALRDVSAGSGSAVGTDEDQPAVRAGEANDGADDTDTDTDAGTDDADAGSTPANDMPR